VKKDLILFSFLKIGRFSITFFNLLLYANYYGVGGDIDSWYVVFGFVSSLSIFMTGGFNEVVRSKFNHLNITNGVDYAVSGFLKTVIAFFFICIVLMFFLFFEIDIVIKLLTGKESNKIIFDMLFFMIPFIFLLSLQDLIVSILQCYGVYRIPELSFILSNAFSIFVFININDFFGIYSIVICFYISFIINFIVIIFVFCKNTSFKLYKKGGGEYFYSFYSLYLPYGVGQFNGIYEKKIGMSMGEGIVSSLQYSSQIKASAQSFFSSVLYAVMMPRLTILAGKEDEFIILWRKCQILIMTFLIFLIPLMYSHSDILINFIFSDVSSGGRVLISKLLSIYFISLWPICLYIMVGVVLISLQKARVYAFFGFISQIIIFIIYFTLSDYMLSFVFPFSQIIAHFIVLFFMIKATKINASCVYKETFTFTFILALSLIFDFSYKSLLYLDGWFFVFVVAKNMIICMVIFQLIKKWRLFDG